MKECASRSEASGWLAAKYAGALALSLGLVGCTAEATVTEAPEVTQQTPDQVSPTPPTASEMPRQPIEPTSTSETTSPTTKTTSSAPTPTPTPTASQSPSTTSSPEVTQPPAETQTPPPVETTSPAPAPTPEPAPTPTPEPTPPPETEPAPTDDSRVIDCMVAKCIALTFDDGPGSYTDELLDYLDDYDAKATFFVVGSRVKSYAPVVRDILNEGHQLGNHSWDHDRLTDKSLDAADNDIRITNDAIEAVAGIRPTIMRPPYGATNQTLVDYIDLPQILWSIDTEDWKYRDSDYVADYVTDNASRGDVILMHDIHSTSVEAVPEILDNLTDQGYEFVTIDTLFSENLPTGIYRKQNI